MTILWALQNIVSGHALQICAAFTTLSVLIVIANISQQILLKRRNEPPVVFHIFPVIGSTITYGIDPFSFFTDCQKKVGLGTSYSLAC